MVLFKCAQHLLAEPWYYHKLGKGIVITLQASRMPNLESIFETINRYNKLMQTVKAILRSRRIYHIIANNKSHGTYSVFTLQSEDAITHLLLSGSAVAVAICLLRFLLVGWPYWQHR